MAAGDVDECRGCRMLARAYASLADVHPITYTAPRWRLCVGVRVLKDVLAARSDSVLPCNIGAILSAYLEHHLVAGGLVSHTDSVCRLNPLPHTPRHFA
jgi:hypothetical protein